MNVENFATTQAEMVEMKRIYHDLEFSQGINERMHIPFKLRVAPYSPENVDNTEPLSCVTMQVPERLGVTGESVNSRFSRPTDMDVVQPHLMLITPPRVLTLDEGPFDAMEPGNAEAIPQSNEEPRFQGRLWRERSASENILSHRSDQLFESTVSPVSTTPVSTCPPPSSVVEDRQNLHSPSSVLAFIQSTTRQAYQQVLEVLDENNQSKPPVGGGFESAPNALHESRLPLASHDSTLDGAEDMAVIDATTLRRQIIKLNRRLQLLEEENKERAKRETMLYSITIAFWLFNTWVWLRR